MTSTTWELEEFAAYEHRGRTFGLVNVCLDVSFDEDPYDFDIERVGLFENRRCDGVWYLDRVWLREDAPLCIAIRQQAMTKYAEQIREFLATELETA